MKTLKKQTPDYKPGGKKDPQIGFRHKDKVYVQKCKPFFSDKEIEGVFLFDTFDTEDGTVFVTKKMNSGFHYNVPLDKINLF